MQTFNNTLGMPRTFGKAFDLYYSGLDVVTFDLETTGLFPARDRIMLSGMLRWDDSSSALVTQYFDETGMNEEEIVRATITFLESSDLIVTYNGRSFDFPFLKRRAKRYGMEYGLDYTLPPDLDLFVLASNYSDIKKLTGSLSQKSVERFMGVDHLRTDEISGGLSVDLYKQYLALPKDKDLCVDGGDNADLGSRDADRGYDSSDYRCYDAADGSEKERLLKQILLHNYDDVTQLGRILGLCGRTDLHRFCYNNGFPAGSCNVETIKVGKDGLTVAATCPSGTSDYISFPTEDRPYHLTVTEQVAEVTFPSRTVSRGIDVIDAAGILGDPDGDVNRRLFKYPAFSSGYLVLKQERRINHLEINQFVKAFFTYIFPAVIDA